MHRLLLGASYVPTKYMHSARSIQALLTAALARLTLTGSCHQSVSLHAIFISTAVSRRASSRHASLTDAKRLALTSASLHRSAGPSAVSFQNGVDDGSAAFRGYFTLLKLNCACRSSYSFRYIAVCKPHAWLFAAQIPFQTIRDCSCCAVDKGM